MQRRARITVAYVGTDFRGFAEADGVRTVMGDAFVAACGSYTTPLLKTEWIKPGAFVVPYGTMSAVELNLTDIMAKLVVDDWGQCKGGQFGSLRAHVEAGKLSAQTLHAEMGQVVAGLRPVSVVLVPAR